MDPQQPTGSPEPSGGNVTPQSPYPPQSPYAPGAVPPQAPYPPQGPYQPQGPYPYQPQGAPAPRLEPIGEAWVTGVAPGRVSSRSSRFRWAIALGIVLIVALVTVGGAFVLSGAGGSAKSLTAGNAPKSTVMFVDLRMDLPGDQHQKLADFMTHFPGFADRAQFDNAFDELLNKITTSISPDLTYTSAFKGWTTGELSVAVTDLGLNPKGSTPGGAAIVGLKDRAAGEKWVASEIARTGTTFTAQDYAGTKLYVGPSTDGVAAAYAFTDKVLLLGTVDAVKAGLDAPSKGSLADDANYKAAMSSFSGDTIASFYVDAQSLISAAMSSVSQMSGTLGLSGASMMGLDTSKLPAWMAGDVRAESDHMLVEMTVPKAGGSSSANNSVSVIASDLPASTVGVFEIHGVGKIVTDALASAGKSNIDASVKTALKQVQDALSAVGGIDWIGDTDLVVTKTGSTYGGGIVVQTVGSASATTKEAMLTNLLTLASAGGSGITQSEETYKGATITLVKIKSGAGGAGVSLPATTLAITTKGSLIVAGYGDAFVKAVLDTTVDTSLASQSTYKAVMSAVGSSNTEYGYFDISAVADQIGQMSSGSKADYNLNIKPYVDHIGGAAFASIDGSTVTLRFVVTAK